MLERGGRLRPPRSIWWPAVISGCDTRSGL